MLKIGGSELRPIGMSQGLYFEQTTRVILMFRGYVSDNCKELFQFKSLYFFTWGNGNSIAIVLRNPDSILVLSLTSCMSFEHITSCLWDSIFLSAGVSETRCILCLLHVRNLCFWGWPGRNESSKSLEISSWHSGDGELSLKNYWWQMGKAMLPGWFPGVGRQSAQDTSITCRTGGEWLGLAGWKLQTQKPHHLGSNYHLYYLLFKKKAYPLESVTWEVVGISWPSTLQIKFIWWIPTGPI